MLLLALDTATPAVTVALHDGRTTLATSHQVDARRHGELLLPAVHRVLASASATPGDLTDVVAGIGPGPYTGLRVGLATAAAFGAALDIPVRGLCTLDGIAYAAGQAGLTGPFVVATDARRKEVYWARYADGRTRVSEPAVDRPADIAEQVAGLPVVGAGGTLYREVFASAGAGPGAALPGVPEGIELPEHQSAAALAALAVEKLAAGEEFPPNQPLYLRRPDAQVPANYKVVTPK
ncbi:tRNA (adenosine(37)-N6)-threonylcarbamoyltransferase complex dimerization subunit type 1 TsaB [Streptomyces buecherae]|uniref:tRNA (Adenosine(37)-N6)-threonylcarbamoyltransferase complex dimerization subunit type 1 TsaB n=1 Tax=Streptomyces buecherae TaxID=2763006 RepID=A0A7H8NBP6_9ACTN|nr:tRNA (adenosine(37)-N6)-threonylcarbamoyltransferase complex dimerization subunit type 1 TsaB [Streptomyces buecherae]QKW51851.1 tRNA (adenosine(37)-N6)-threonylcarbamoyltransferase complex dimerization subunit type 1 TsaB [Streptomyces buecherae]